MGEKVIVWISHDRHRDDLVKVIQYSEKNLKKVCEAMEKSWKDGEWGFFGDLPCSHGGQFGWDDSYYDSYSIVEVEDLKE